MKKFTKQQELYRIRAEGPSKEDLSDERPRVRRAALIMLSFSDSLEERANAIKMASQDSSDAVYLSTMRAYLRGGAEALAQYPDALIDTMGQDEVWIKVP